MNNWLNKEVITIKDMEKLPKGSIGICTADLPKDNIFAVWFYNIALKPEWCRFNYDMKKEYFEVKKRGINNE